MTAYYFFSNQTKKTIKNNYNKVLISIMPIIPHFASECIEKNEFKNNQCCPSFNEKLLVESNINYVIQINGKKRALINEKREIVEEKLLEIIKKNENLFKYLNNKKIIKIIFIKNKLMNIIV